ncbi:MAG: ankyrin repeat domain-containing protein [Alphaproteobacteria bacterium]|nr:ankyrin repeat domain-containing protein [Alphaproteobacteria bacterium]
MKKIIFFISTIIFSSNFSMSHLPGEQSNDTDPNSNQEIIDIQSTDSNSDDSYECESDDPDDPNDPDYEFKSFVKSIKQIEFLSQDTKKSLLCFKIGQGEKDQLAYLTKELGISINTVDDDGNSCLHTFATCLIGCKDLRIIEQTLALNIDPNIQNKKGNTAILHYFSDKEFKPSKQEIELFSLLIKNKADLHLKNKKGDDAFTILFSKKHYFSDDRINLINYLLNHGFFINERNGKGKTLLHKLCKNSCNYNKYFEFIKMLVDEKNADVNAIDGNGKTPLYYTYDKDIARYLISKGADADSLNRNGQKWSDILN